MAFDWTTYNNFGKQQFDPTAMGWTGDGSGSYTRQGPNGPEALNSEDFQNLQAQFPIQQQAAARGYANGFNVYNSDNPDGNTLDPKVAAWYQQRGIAPTVRNDFQYQYGPGNFIQNPDNGQWMYQASTNKQPGGYTIADEENASAGLMNGSWIPALALGALGAGAAGLLPGTTALGASAAGSLGGGSFLAANDAAMAGAGAGGLASGSAAGLAGEGLGAASLAGSGLTTAGGLGTSLGGLGSTLTGADAGIGTGLNFAGLDPMSGFSGTQGGLTADQINALNNVTIDGNPASNVYNSGNGDWLQNALNDGNLPANAGSGLPTGSTSLLQRLLSGGGNAQDYLKLAGILGSVGLGAAGADASRSASNSVADKYLALGAPSRARLEASYAPGFSMMNDPGYKDALDSTMNSYLRKASTGGNPFENPGVSAEALKYVDSNMAYPALSNYRSQNAASGQLGVPIAGTNSTNAASTAATPFNAAQYGIGAITNPPSNINDLLSSLGINTAKLATGATIT